MKEKRRSHPTNKSGGLSRFCRKQIESSQKHVTVVFFVGLLDRICIDRIYSHFSCSRCNTPSSIFQKEKWRLISPWLKAGVLRRQR